MPFWRRPKFLNDHGHATVVLFHFGSELRLFLDFCENHQKNWMIHATEFKESSECKALTGTAGMVLASQRDERLLSSEREMVCILADCHPLPAKDKHVLDSLLSKESNDAAFQFVSVDESPIRSIRSSWFLKEKLFLSKGKRCFVESRFWQGLLNSERRQYIVTAASDTPVNSADEWIDVNCVSTGATDL